MTASLLTLDDRKCRETALKYVKHYFVFAFLFFFSNNRLPFLVAFFVHCRLAWYIESVVSVAIINNYFRSSITEDALKSLV